MHPADALFPKRQLSFLCTFGVILRLYVIHIITSADVYLVYLSFFGLLLSRITQKSFRRICV